MWDKTRMSQRKAAINDRGFTQLYAALSGMAWAKSLCRQ
jgi:hypothetical protein